MPSAHTAAIIAVVSSRLTACNFDAGPLFTSQPSSGAQMSAEEQPAGSESPSPPDSGAVAAEEGIEAGADTPMEADADTEFVDAAVPVPPAPVDAGMPVVGPMPRTAEEVRDAGSAPSATCAVTRETIAVEQTIVVAAEATFDGDCRRYTVGRGLQRASMGDSDQTPMFRLAPGARMVNVVINSAGVDAIHTLGDAQLNNVSWEAIGDEALTIRESGTVVIEGGSALHAQNAVFQINAASTFRINRLRAFEAKKFIRQNNGTTYRVDVQIDGCDISAMMEGIFRTDSSASRLTMTNTRYSKIGGELFPGVNPRNIMLSGNAQY